MANLFGTDELAFSPYVPFLARLTAVASGTSGQASWNLYSWTEQGYDEFGFPVDFAAGRTGTPASGYAVEANNALLTVPGSTPSGYANPGPYAWLRLKGVVQGAPFYEFTAAQAGGGTNFVIDIEPPSLPTATIGQPYHQKIMATVMSGDLLIVNSSPVHGGTGGFLSEANGILVEPTLVGLSSGGNFFTKSATKPTDLNNGQGQLWFKDS